ncbi:bifunctional proline dehydrogenase/L-glutamate gamma-semialdehyde dehydrogenase PutA [Ferruginivarius sediminum]|uniref:Bifunctional protein PutA n=1 Tax=Ferruginivarius sediminum TaxID=2661937 RepID=A0A369TEF3_9PROT|nr:bifunctional proline dehydrogenase/L-glutamate gamma-semialdehyde dehydrogenase PutA [Ferruginivarius sediminum]RDD63683.1 bifunctional proline dehydrogenase/L-glutamate gamma-semialdehyde dehydrogenase PutA [Ferruginivarius sediminum]
MIIDPQLAEAGALRKAVRDAYRAEEADVVRQRLREAELSAQARERVAETARQLVKGVRDEHNPGGIEAFMHEYELSSKEGIVLMCLAEALLRVPDSETMDALIKDKIATADWEAHLGHSESMFVNASTWALMMTGRVVRLESEERRDYARVLRRLIHRSGEPFIRSAVWQAMRILGRQFVMGRNIDEALDRARASEKKGYRYSYDMLGEAARTMADSDDYYASYLAAIEAIGKAAKGRGPIEAPGISVKLSALHPRYEFAKRERVMAELLPRMRDIALAAAKHDIGLCIDAEETERLDISLDVIEAISGDPELKDWQGFGLAVQAYQKRAAPLIDWLADMARRHGRKLMVRLVKGAYWDTEIKHCQERGLEEYPVFTRKMNTDVCYLACVQRMLDAEDAIYPQFASHNAHTVAYVLEAAGNRRDFEFQRLHGMGEPLYDQVVDPAAHGLPCRIYAPVGGHEDLLPYLVRRLLENGANTSFVSHVTDERVPIDDIVADPIEAVKRQTQIRHPRIPLPRDLYGEGRVNSRGVDLSDPQALAALGKEMDRAAAQSWEATPIVGGQARRDGKAASQQVMDPADNTRVVGEVTWSDQDTIEQALARAERAQWDWDNTPAARRADILRRAADDMESRMGELMAMCTREAGKSIPDGVAEVREAVDFLRYYAVQAERNFSEPQVMPGPTGERNELYLRGRGTFVCISPWNFPLAIFTGQVSAALAAGNCVIAKPAEQTPLIAAAAVRILHRAGVPQDALHLLPGDGPGVGAPLIADPRIAGVAFTGSVETAKLINRKLAERDGPILPFIAETGGQNAMIVDSSALPEQVAADVLYSAFASAGQRCSALRVLFVQDDVADKMINMLAGAMDELKVGDPALLSTDVGPVIDSEARDMLEGHAKAMANQARTIRRLELGPECANGTFVAPGAFEIDSINRLQREVFGPILHVVRYQGGHLDKVIDAINATGYGLTHGIHTRIDHVVEHISRRIKVGNCYVNRNTIGSVVGVQPFGGEGLSGTGPKAGGPHYMLRFATERTLTIDTTAAGGNASLLSMDESLPM